MGHLDLAEHYYKCGDYDNALKCYTRIRDYCTLPKQLLDQCLEAINVGFQMRNYSTVQAYIAKAQSAPDGPDKDAISSKLKASAAVYALVSNKYTAAGADFLQIGPELGSTYNEVSLMFNTSLTLDPICQRCCCLWRFVRIGVFRS
jgi:COP9 signalosome complex subunit 1